MTKTRTKKRERADLAAGLKLVDATSAKDSLMEAAKAAVRKYPANTPNAIETLLATVSGSLAMTLAMFSDAERTMAGRRAIVAAQAALKPPIKVTAHDRARRPTAAASLGYGSTAGLAARADVCRKALLDRETINGKPVRLCTVAEADAYRDKSEHRNIWIKRLTERLHPQAVIGDHRSDKDAITFWNSAALEFSGIASAAE